ncbi:hypothetical protein Tco_1570680 [Tanacetum coccineum]
MKAILRKDKCLAAFGERSAELTSLSCKIEPHECVDILLQSLPDSYDQLIISLTSNVLSNYLVFDDVATAILEEENRHNNREDMKTSSRQVEALVVTRGRSMEPGSSESHNHGKSKTGKKKNFKCFKCGKPSAVANEGRKIFADDVQFESLKESFSSSSSGTLKIKIIFTSVFVTVKNLKDKDLSTELHFSLVDIPVKMSISLTKILEMIWFQILKFKRQEKGLLYVKRKQ